MLHVIIISTIASLLLHNIMYAYIYIVIYIYSYIYTRMSVHVCLSIKHGADIYRPLTSEETPPPRVEVYKT